MDCAIISTGIAYSPKTEKAEETYFALPCVNILGCDLSVDIAGVMSNWNIQVHNWLKYYVMMRWLDKTKPRHVV
jgi:hypothetical protein